MNPWMQAVLRISQGHYGGRPSQKWLQRLGQSPEARTTLGQRLMFNLGNGTPQQVMGMSKDKIGPYFG